eukprot:s1666_g12.t1
MAATTEIWQMPEIRRNMLIDAGFTDINIAIKENAADIIKDWIPGSGAEKPRIPCETMSGLWQDAATPRSLQPWPASQALDPVPEAKRGSWTVVQGFRAQRLNLRFVLRKFLAVCLGICDAEEPFDGMGIQH